MIQASDCPAAAASEAAQSARAAGSRREKRMRGIRGDRVPLERRTFPFPRFPCRTSGRPIRRESASPAAPPGEQFLAVGGSVPHGLHVAAEAGNVGGDLLEEALEVGGVVPEP